MTEMQLAVGAGIMVGVGVWLVILRLVPAHPDLGRALTMLGPLVDSRPQTRTASTWETVGEWGLAKLPERIRPVPAQDLALLGLTPARFLARKMTYALVGLVFPALGTLAALLGGLSLPWVAPGLFTLVCAGVGFILPDLDVRRRAEAARREWVRTLACYVDLVALERSCGSGTSQALDVAVDVGDSRVFERLRETLERSKWAGTAPWDGLSDLAGDLNLPDLGDVADIVRLSATEGAGIYRTLRAKARSLREGILTTELTRANETNERMSLPVSVLGIVFLAILIGPALLSMMETVA